MYSKTSILLFFCLMSIGLFAQPNVSLTLFSSGFSNPVDIAHAGDDRIFLVEQGGTIWILDNQGNKQTTPFLSRSVTSGGERGLLGLVFDPNYATNGYFYIYYSQGSNSRISRYSVSSGNPDVADPSSETIIMTIPQPFSNHNGGDLAFGPDGYLYIGLGDGGSGGDPGNRSQNPQELLGKMLRIDVSSLPYSIPASNPFVGDPSTLDEIWAIGLRNPWRWSFDRETGDLWIGDVGQGAREEIHYTPAGSPGGHNYGWRCYEGNLPFNTSGCGPIGNYEFPVEDYPRIEGSSVTGGFVYRGELSPNLDGIYFYGDYGSGRLWGMWPDIVNPGSWTVHEFMNTSFQWSTFGEDQHGELYGADYNSGNIYRIDGPCASFGISLTTTDATCPDAANGTISIDVSAGFVLDSILWSNDSTVQFLTNLDTGTYEVTVIDTSGCLRIDSVVIQAGVVPPVPSITPQGLTQICPGNNVVLLADPAPAGFAYQWILNGTVLPGFNNQSFSAGLPGNIQVTYNGPCPVDTSTVIQVEGVPFPPTPLLGGDSSGTYCDATDLVLISSSAPNAFFYQWYQDSMPLSIGGDTLPIVSSGTYHVVFDGPCASPASAAVSIQLENTPPQPIFGMDSVDICQGDQALLDGGMAPAMYGYQWYKDGTAIPGATQQAYQTDEAGDYALSYVGICSTDPSDPVSLVVRALPTPLIGQVGDTLSVSEGIAWQWLLEGNPINGANGATYVAQASGTYTVELTDEFGCQGSSSELFVVLTSLEEWFVEGAVDVVPNPAKDWINVAFHSLKSGSFRLSLLDMQGKLLTSRQVNALPGEQTIQLSTEQLTDGMYVIRLEGEGVRYTTRVGVVK
ncbi:MAG: PQQ-dependent sugar dehydrogenase [Bacteroidota bacterium]